MSWDIRNILINVKKDINTLTATSATTATAVSTLSDDYIALEARVKALEDAQPTPELDNNKNNERSFSKWLHQTKI